MSRPASPPPQGPLPIRRLDEALVNRIAAGEIIQRPASALKELIENALDAGSTQIKVMVKDGGLKLLQIADNGCGIRKSDLAILCERFTTSKLSDFSDLQSLTTYGFRGEALASISHVSHLSVTTKTKEEACAWKAYYADGALVPPKPGMTADPKACAGNGGTTITAEDLFYNTPTRLAALRSSSDEYARILDVVTRYAVHNPGISFTCKKLGTSAPDVSTPSSSTIPTTIKLLYGNGVASELLHVTMSSETRNKKQRLKGKGKGKADESEWTAEAYVTSPNHQAKKMTFLLFINHRLVESTKLKRAIEAIYTPILPKGSSPFVYLSLDIEPSQVDVNVHPTKREVHFLNEDEVVSDICDAIQLKVASQGESRTFEYQTLLTGGIASVGLATGRKEREKKRKQTDDEDEVMLDGEDDGGGGDAPTNATPQTGTPLAKKPLPQHKIRTSAKDRTLESMFVVQNPAQVGGSGLSSGTKGDILEAATDLASVMGLRAQVLKHRHKGLTEIFSEHTFVGLVDMKLSLSLIQHAKNLYLVNHGTLSEELFYQLGLRQFGKFGRFMLQPSPPIHTLIKLAIEAEEGDEVRKSGMNPAEAIEAIKDILMERRELLNELFSISINEAGELESLPILLKDYTPNLDRLPQFLMRLGPGVDWYDETACFQSLLREIAFFYRPGPLEAFIDVKPPDDLQKDPAEEKAERWQLEHALFPAMRKYLLPPKTLLDGTVTRVANLPDLYRVFERC